MDPSSIQLSDFVESMPVAIVAINTEAQIALFNEEAERLFGYEPGKLIGESLTRLIPARFIEKHQIFLKSFFKSPSRKLLGKGREMSALRSDGTEFPVEIALGYVRSPHGLLATAVVADISDRLKQHEERTDLIRDRKAALTNAKQLSGLLPICANCKKIRDDKGYWSQIESYISKHSAADFSHGICPECFEDQCPDLEQD